MKPAICGNCGKECKGSVPDDAQHVTCFLCSEIPDRRKVVLRAVALTEAHARINGQYLKSFDIEAHGGQGSAEFTNRLSKAHRFDSIKDALAEYSKVSVTRPLRDDGQPNCPLRAFTVEIISVGRASRQDGEQRASRRPK